MTTVGENRRRYSAEVELHPSRFTNPAAYRAWAARADEWAERQGLARPSRRAGITQPVADKPEPMVRVSADTWVYRRPQGTQQAFEFEGIAS